MGESTLKFEAGKQDNHPSDGQTGSLCSFLSDFRGRTSACFPVSPHRGINYPPPAFVFLHFHKVEEVQHIAFIPFDSHSGFYFPPTSVGPPLSSERETCYMLPCIPTRWYQRWAELLVGKSCPATLGSANSFGIRVCAITLKDRLEVRGGCGNFL